MTTPKRKKLIKQLIELLNEEEEEEQEPKADALARNSYTLKEIAQRNGFSVPYVYAEVSRGNLKVYRPGGTGHMRATHDQEAKWLARAEVPAAPKKAAGKRKKARERAEV